LKKNWGKTINSFSKKQLTKYIVEGVIMKDVILRDKTKELVVDSIILAKKLKENKTEQKLIDSFLNAITSAGMYVNELKYIHSRRDTVAKYEDALKECNEVEYWLEIFFSINSINEEDYEAYKEKWAELCRMISASVRTIKPKLNN
jgi:four helix bundle protein